MEKYEHLRRVESGARTYASTFDRVFASGLGARVWDEKGREFIDCLCCAGALPLGHNPPEVRDDVLRFVASGQLQQALDLSTPAKFEFVEELFSLLPSEFASRAKIHFCGPSGSDAVEAAMKLTRVATRRQPIIAFRGAYHGMTSGALFAMGNVMPKAALAGTGSIHFAPYPHGLHCPFGSGGDDTDRLSLNYLRTLLTDPESGVPKPAAVIVEVVQGEGGCVAASERWLHGLRELTLQQQVPLIIDEVQTGIGRTGRMFAFEHAGIIPDVLVLSKAIGGGYPLAAVVYDAALNVWPPGMHAGTFRGNQVAMVAGRSTMNIVRRDGLARIAAETGEHLRRGLLEIARRHPILVDVRGRGLMLGVEVSRSAGDGQPSPGDGALASKVKQAAFKNGLLIETGGRYGSVLRLLPPLTLSEAEAALILERLEAAVASAMQEG